MGSRRLDEVKQKTAEGLELMAETIEAQDKVIRNTLRAAQDSVTVSSAAQTLALEAKNTAEDAHNKIVTLERYTVLEKFQWFFKGPWW